MPAGEVGAYAGNATIDPTPRRGKTPPAMSALPQTIDVATPAITRPAWVDKLERAGRITAMCLLVLLVPGEAYRCSAGARLPRP